MGSIMHAKYRCLLSAFVLACTILAAPSAQAIVINAADYAVGTNLTHAVPGVILQDAVYDGSGPTFITLPLIISSTDAEALGATIITFGGTNTGGYPPFQIPPTEGPWVATYAAFTVPVHSVTALGFNLDGDPAAMVAYGQNGQQLVTEIDNGGPLPIPCIKSLYAQCLFGHEETVSSTTPISYVLFGSTSESTYFTELYIPGISGVVPEPSSLALFGFGILAIGFAALCRRHFVQRARIPRAFARSLSY